ncbi:hypothetical protein ACFVGO_34110, partial [Kitasatospora sp. NPDC057738]
MISSVSRASATRLLLRRTCVAGAAVAAVAGQLLAAPTIADARGSGTPSGPEAGVQHAQQAQPAQRAKQRATTIAENQLPFTTRFAGDFRGSITRISNSLMTCDETKAPLDPEQPPCLDARKGLGPRPINNKYEMNYINIDPGSVGPLGDAIYSASSADLGLIDGSQV